MLQNAHKWVFLGPQADLEEERIRQKIAERTSEETIRIYSLRLFLNCIVLAVLAACFYAIYLATTFSQEHMKKVSVPWESVDLVPWRGSVPDALQISVEDTNIISLFEWKEKFSGYRNGESADQKPLFWEYLFPPEEFTVFRSKPGCLCFLTLLVHTQNLSL